MKDPLEDLRHSWWRRAYLILVCVAGIVGFQLNVLPRACRIALTHVRDRRVRVRNVRYSARSARNLLDVYRVPDAVGLCPVVVFCHGGAWDSGDKLHYCTLAKTLRNDNVVTVIINYTLYPQGLVADMVHDITAALTWTKANIKKFGGDPNNIYFLGHSAGAQLGALALLNRTLEKTVQDHDLLLRGFIGLAGPYDIRSHYEHEYTRGLENLSPMKPTMGGIPNFHLHSPSSLALSLTKHHLPKLCNFYLLHGDLDATVPVSSSVKFAKNLNEAGVSVVLFEYKGLGHSHVLFDLMDNLQTSPVVRDILRIVNPSAHQKKK